MSKKKKKAKKHKQQAAPKPSPLRYILPAALILVLAVVVVLLISNNNDDEEGSDEAVHTDIYPVAVIEMESGGVIKVELDPQNAPNTVKNFIYLAGQGFYDGLIFHRVIDGFMIQGGCPEGTGTGGPGHNIRGEFTANGHTNELTHDRGVISMARSRPLDSAGSQFFITVEATPHLDGQYAAFGRVIEGMEEVDRIALVERDPATDRPLVEERIKTVTVETFGVEFGPPDKL